MNEMNKFSETMLNKITEILEKEEVIVNEKIYYNKIQHVLKNGYFIEEKMNAKDYIEKLKELEKWLFSSDHEVIINHEEKIPCRMNQSKAFTCENCGGIHDWLKAVVLVYGPEFHMRNILCINCFKNLERTFTFK